MSAKERDALAELFEAHLSTGLGCHCDKWTVDTRRRPVNPRRQHRAHVADAVLAAGWLPPGTDTAREALDEVERRIRAEAAGWRHGGYPSWRAVVRHITDVRSALGDRRTETGQTP